MGKILLIEPQRIVRQAISLCLFPEHEVRSEEGVTGSLAASFRDYDLLIVDGAALREKNQLTPELTRAIQECKTPTLWLEEDKPGQPLKCEKLLVVKKPIEREEFQSAVASFLAPSAIPKRRVRPSTPPGARMDAPGRETKKAAGESSQQETFQFIDLVDVVEEPPQPNQRRKPPPKST